MDKGEIPFPFFCPCHLQVGKKAGPVPSPATALERSGLEPQLGSTVELPLVGVGGRTGKPALR